MPTDEKFRLMDQQFFFCFGIILGRIATNMPDHHFYFFTIKNQLFRKFASYVLPVNISIDPLQRFYRFKPVCNFNGTKIAGMPYFITAFKMFENIFIEIAMSV